MARVPRPGGTLCLLDIIFASEAALSAAREELAPSWEPTEVYHLVSGLDAQFHSVGFGQPWWRRTARCHWAVVVGRQESRRRTAIRGLLYWVGKRIAEST